MNIGMGLVSADSFFKADDERKARERTEQRFDWEKQRNESDLSTLPEKTDATRSGYQLRDAQNKATSSLVPAQTGLASSKLSLEQADVDFNKEVQPVKQEIAAAKLDRENDNQANLDYEQFAKGELTKDQLREMTTGRAAKYLANNDKAGYIRYSNSVRQHPDLFPETNSSSDIVNVEAVKVDGVPVYRHTLADGTVKDTPFSVFSGAAASMKSGKFKAVKGADGSINVMNENTGTVTTPIKGDPSLMAGKNQHAPAEINTAEWLIKNGVAKDAPQAWSMVRSAREKTKSSFIADMAKNAILPNSKPEDIMKLETSFGEMYDRLHASGPGLSSNTSAPSTLNPQVKSLLGIP